MLDVWMDGQPISQCIAFINDVSIQGGEGLPKLILTDMGGRGVKNGPKLTDVKN